MLKALMRLSLHEDFDKALRDARAGGLLTRLEARCENFMIMLTSICDPSKTWLAGEANGSGWTSSTYEYSST
jgi:hypothetical protein